MSVVIDQVSGRVEPKRGPAAGGPEGEAPAPREREGRDLERQLRQLLSRRLRLQAD